MQSPQEQRAIVQRMIDAGESEENIATVIRHFQTKQDTQKQTTTLPPSGGMMDAVKGFWEKQPIHPIDMVMGASNLMRQGMDAISGRPQALMNTGRSLLEAQDVPRARSAEAFRRGDPITGLVEGVNWILPVVGPQMSEAQRQVQAGEISTPRFLGESLGIGVQVAVPPVAQRGGSVRVLPRMQNPNPTMRAAVAFAEREGIPVDAATATGNPAVRGAQYVADRSLGGAQIGARARAAQETALTETGRRLAGQASSARSSPYQAGEAIQQALDTRIQQYGIEATAAYDAFRVIENDAAQTQKVQIRIPTTAADGSTKMTTVTTDMQMPVNLKTAKAQLRPVFDRMMRQMPVAQQRADPALHAIKNILDAPDYLPASMVDMDLGAIKEIARSGGGGISQGLAKSAVHTLETELQKVVAQAGPKAQQALADGRNATASKYSVQNILKNVAKEPRQAFDQAVWKRDSGIDQLTSIAEEAPGVMPQIGRAYLDNLIDLAAVEGGFDKAGRLANEWQQLGPKTKALLFPNAQLRADLDNFFIVAKQMATNPNPSGTAIVGAQAGQGVLLVTEPITGGVLTLTGSALSKFLHSPGGARLLTRGMRVPVGGNRAAGVAAFGAIANALQNEGIIKRDRP